MRCDEVVEQLSAMLDGELTAAETAEVRAHLADCPSCRAEWTALSRTAQAVKDLPAIRAPKRFSHEVMARVREQPVSAPSWGARLRPWWPAAAAMVVAGLIALFYPSDNPRHKTVAKQETPGGETRKEVAMLPSGTGGAAASADEAAGRARMEAAPIPPAEDAGAAGEGAEGAPLAPAVAGAGEAGAAQDKAVAAAAVSPRAPSAPATASAPAAPPSPGTVVAMRKSETPSFGAATKPSVSGNALNGAPAAAATPTNTLFSRPAPAAPGEIVEVIPIRSRNPRAAMDRAVAILAKRGWNSPAKNVPSPSQTKGANGAASPQAPASNAMQLTVRLPASQVAVLRHDLEAAGLLPSATGAAPDRNALRTPAPRPGEPLRRVMLVFSLGEDPAPAPAPAQ